MRPSKRSTAHASSSCAVRPSNSSASASTSARERVRVLTSAKQATRVNESNAADKRGSNTRLVYSSEGGRVSPERPGDAAARPRRAGDGVVRVSRTSSGRRGKTVTLVTGLPAADVAGRGEGAEAALRVGRLGQGRRGRDPGRPARADHRPPGGALPGQGHRGLAAGDRHGDLQPPAEGALHDRRLERRRPQRHRRVAHGPHDQPQRAPSGASSRSSRIAARRGRARAARRSAGSRPAAAACPRPSSGRLGPTLRRRRMPSSGARLGSALAVAAHQQGDHRQLGVRGSPGRPAFSTR